MSQSSNKSANPPGLNAAPSSSGEADGDLRHYKCEASKGALWQGGEPDYDLLPAFAQILFRDQGVHLRNSKIELQFSKGIYMYDMFAFDEEKEFKEFQKSADAKPHFIEKCVDMGDYQNICLHINALFDALVAEGLYESLVIKRSTEKPE